MKSLTEDKRSYIKVTTVTNPSGLSHASSLGCVMKSIPSGPTTSVWVLLNFNSPTLPFTSTDLLCPSSILTLPIKGRTLLFRSTVSQVTRDALTSNLTQGVDNTGQTRIWECATLTLRYLTSRYPSTSLGSVVELGCGMVGFSGLFHDGVVTDGHDSGVFNNRVNAELNGRGRARKLLWDEGEKGRKECLSVGKFSTVVVSDCVHFRDFHYSLLTTILRLLTVSGFALLVQPTRGGSLDALRRIVGDDGPLVWGEETAEEADEEVWVGHLGNIGEGGHPGYRVDAHLPVYVTLTKIREFDEVRDGGGIRERVEGERRRREEERGKRKKAQQANGI